MNRDTIKNLNKLKNQRKEDKYDLNSRRKTMKKLNKKQNTRSIIDSLSFKEIEQSDNG